MDANRYDGRERVCAGMTRGVEDGRGSTQFKY